MQAAIPNITSRLETLPLPVGVVLPGGQRAGPQDAAVELHFHHWAGVAKLAAGQIGSVGEDYVEGRMDILGSMRDVMATAAALLPGDPVESNTGWWSNMLLRAKSLAAHTRTKDAEQIQFHYDVSDAFYALWLDERRVYSCAYYRDAGMSLAQAQEAKLDHICRT